VKIKGTHWETLDGEDTVFNPCGFGFIYCIINLVEEKRYIGRKQMWNRVKRKPLKGKKNHRISSKESDWKTYCGSSKDLLADIERLGKSNFRFVIIEMCNSKWALQYYEMEWILFANALFRDDFYNKELRVRVGKAPKMEH